MGSSVLEKKKMHYPVMTEKHVADRWQVSLKTLRRGGHVRYHEADIREFGTTATGPATAPPRIALSSPAFSMAVSSRSFRIELIRVMRCDSSKASKMS